MTMLLSCARLLLAAALLILVPAAAAAGALPPAWMAPVWMAGALVPLTATSCLLQRYHAPRLVLACAASNAAMLGVVWLATTAGLRLISLF